METDIRVRNGNLRRKRLPCLRCGRAFWTDRCHRICARCHRLRRMSGAWDILSLLLMPSKNRKTLAREPGSKAAV